MSSDVILKSRESRFKELAQWLFGFVLLTFVMPIILILILPSGQRAAGIATLAATPVFEYIAVSIGIGFGLNPVLSFLLTLLPLTGISMLIIGLLGFGGDSSERARRFLNKIQDKIAKYPRLQKYGVVSNLLFVMFLGIYICSGISVLLGWPRWKSLVYMVGGISLITLIIGLGTIGIIDLFFV
jgi:hypothetical protein